MLGWNRWMDLEIQEMGGYHFRVKEKSSLQHFIDIIFY